MTIAIKSFTRLNVKNNVKVTARPAVHARFAFVGNSQLHTIIHTRGNLNREFAFVGLNALTAASRARILNGRTFAATTRASRCYRKKSLTPPDLANPATSFASAPFTPLFCASTAAGV